ncbi:cytochrome P450 [Dendrothele bispora CBS 962.96]|uniref:Cytochrome P450 n=1 Tax=Dendrothele bispora (strain CBS 962.96) TaxID=1314807 RepID=A0A4S8LV11_DENBC|nr:cytochrome P450 [Dendrothele bispora CBS 962.96]
MMMIYYDQNPSSWAVLILVFFLAVKFFRACYEKYKLDHIPTIGPKGVFTSYKTVYRWITQANEIIDEGYRLHPGGICKIPTMDGWQIVLNGGKLVDDMREASDEVLSADVFTEEVLQAYYTMHPNVIKSSYHTDVIRSPLTRNIGPRLSDIYDEVKAAISEKIPLSNDWIGIAAKEKSLDVVVRTANRFFVGLSLCRDPDFCDLNIKFTSNVFYNSLRINLFPKFLHPIVGRIFTTRNSSLRRMVKHLKPVIEERLRMREQFGKDWPDKPNDFIQWSIDAEAYAPFSQRTSVEDLCVRVLFANFGAVHATSVAFTYALFNLACRPELIETLRKEVQTLTEDEGWTKPALSKMRLLDSFLMESARLYGVRANGLMRKSTRDFTFSNGVTVPAGTLITVATRPMMRDNAIFPRGEEFNPFRFAELREKDGEGFKHQMVTPTSEWVLFGQGKHACPGRFFASTVLKLLMAHVLLHYDIKFPNASRELPPSFKQFADFAPDPNARVLFRKRADC